MHEVMLSRDKRVKLGLWVFKLLAVVVRAFDKCIIGYWYSMVSQNTDFLTNCLFVYLE